MAKTSQQRFFPTCYGKEFTDRLFGLRKRAATGAHKLVTLYAALDIEHRLTPPKSPQTNGMVERFNGRIEEVLQSHHFRSGEELETTLHRYDWLYNQQLPQSTFGSKTPLQAMKDWHKIKPELFKKQPYSRRDVTANWVFGSSSLSLFFILRVIVTHPGHTSLRSLIDAQMAPLQYVLDRLWRAPLSGALQSAQQIFSASSANLVR